MSRPSKLPSDNPSDDICPVCKSNRYLNPSLQFLINPECYHKMCSTCVDRIFTAGPASCPVPHCGKTLRKKGFHKAFFADLKIEREVDVRKRVGAVFNKRQDDFETLMDWNNYLEDVEEMVFDILEGSLKDRQQAEEKLRAFREGNRAEIEQNRRAGQEEVEMERQREKAEKEAARESRLAVLREVEEQKADLEKSRRDVLDLLATTDGDANKVVKQAQKIILKKTSARRNLSFAPKVEANGSAMDSGLSIRGLKKRETPMVEKPYDPFGGVDLTPSRYVLQQEYNNEWLGNAKGDLRHMAGGYSFQEYYSRTMFEAFSGMAVFIEDEFTTQRASSGVGTAAAAQVSSGNIKTENKMELDDVF